MEQISDVAFRAEKTYKNSREKFGLVLREIVSNAIHAVLIKAEKEKSSSYHPTVTLKCFVCDKEIKITIQDNGEGFTPVNCKYFTHLDLKNSEKEQYGFFPQGQGRLAIIHFTDGAVYTSTYSGSDGHIYETRFTYPQYEVELFTIENEKKTASTTSTTGTKVELNIHSLNKCGRARTFFSQYNTSEKLRYWLTDNFLPFFIEFKQLSLIVEYADDAFTLNRDALEHEFQNLTFEAIPDEQNQQSHTFRVWLIKTNKPAKSTVLCYARHLQAELENGRLEYDIYTGENVNRIITSEYFDAYVNSKGDKIEIPESEIIQIQTRLSETLDTHYKKEIEQNRDTTKNNIRSMKKRYPSLQVFIDDDAYICARNIAKERDLVDAAIEEKGRIEKNYWQNRNAETEETHKLINSSLHIYIDHRQRVLVKLKNMINLFTQNGEDNKSAEKDIHDLILKRGTQLSNSENINHLHNLWLLDDKYTVFSQTKRALSSKQGQNLSDIYLWINDPEQVNELLILELKSTTKAHNAGDIHESMIAQVKRYAADFYKNPGKTVGWDIEPEKILFSGVILARKSDINRELNSTTTSGIAHKIPFLQNSHFYNERFSIVGDNASTPIYKDIRIELYSFEDILTLAENRNNVFFKLLNGEYAITTDVASAESTDA